MSIGDFPESFRQAILVGIMLVGKSGVTFTIALPATERRAIANLDTAQTHLLGRVYGSNNNASDHVRLL